VIFNSNTAQECIRNGCEIVATIRKKGYYKVGGRVRIKLGGRKLQDRVVVVIPLSSLSSREFKGGRKTPSVSDGWIAPFVVTFKYVFFKYPINARRRVPF